MSVNFGADHLNLPTPLHEAAKAQSRDAVALLLELGASVSAVDEGGATPVHTAARYYRAGVAELIVAKADARTLNLKDRAGFTALCVAALGRMRDAVV